MNTFPEINTVEPPRPRPRRLGWRHVVYALSVLLSSALAFGPALVLWAQPAWPEHFQWEPYPFYGFGRGIAVVFVWAVIWFRWFSRRTFWNLIVASVIVVLFAVYAYPMTSMSRGSSRRGQCSNNLKQIALALHNYHDDYGSFPPAFVSDANGKPAHSWRVLLLPYLDYRSVYDQYNFDELWDSPANRDLPLEKTLHQYHCPSAGFDNEDERLLASYLAVIGPGTSWTTDGRKIHDVTDGTNETVWLIEAPQKKIYWNEPRDISMDEAIALLTGPPQADDRGHYWSDHILFVDGSVRTTPFGLTPADWRAMFTIAAGDNVPDVTRFGKHHEIDRYRMHRTAAYWVFWLLAALPLGWVWRPTTRRIVIGQ